MERTAIVVLGMHRSGTSAFTKSISLLGADLPGRLLGPVPGDNERGYWEPEKVVALHDALFREVSSDWSDPLPLPEAFFDSDPAQGYEDRFVDYLRADFSASRTFVLKDPRMCRLVPLWSRALRRFGGEPRFVLAMRNPLEVAASLERRDPRFSTELSALLWLGHVLDSLWYTRGECRVVACYDELLADWRGTLSRIGEGLGLQWNSALEAGGAAIDRFLTQDLRHHFGPSSEAAARPPLMRRALQLHEACRKTASGAGFPDMLVDRERTAYIAEAATFRPLVAHLFRERHREGERADAAAVERDALRRRLDVAKRDLDITHRERETADRDRAAAREALAVARRDLEAAANDLDTAAHDLEALRAELRETNLRLAAFRRWTGMALLGRLLGRS